MPTNLAASQESLSRMNFNSGWISLRYGDASHTNKFDVIRMDRMLSASNKTRHAKFLFRETLLCYRYVHMWTAVMHFSYQGLATPESKTCNTLTLQEQQSNRNHSYQLFKSFNRHSATSLHGSFHLHHHRHNNRILHFDGILGPTLPTSSKRSYKPSSMPATEPFPTVPLQSKLRHRAHDDPQRCRFWMPS